MTAMGATKMHADEIETDVALARRLLAEQFPQWADLPIIPVASYGTDHDIYTTGAHPRPPHGRGGSLAEGDEHVRRSIAQLGDRIDGDATLRSW
jgi:aminoglycoside phosphotransferase (APT) family kinase protein